MKTCPFCAEEIQKTAIKCKHCGSMLNEPASKPNSENIEIESPDLREKGHPIILLLIIIALIFGIAAGHHDLKEGVLVFSGAAIVFIPLGWALENWISKIHQEAEKGPGKH